MNCPHCGKVLIEPSPDFCSGCGKRLQDVSSTTNTPQASAETTQPCPTPIFLEHRKKKNAKRKKFSRGRKGWKPTGRNIVNINVGLMTFKGKYLKPQHGCTFPLRTNTDITAPSLLNEAVKKIKDFIEVKDVEDKGPFLLLYPDGTEVINIPGTQRPFTLDAYKAKVGKAYQRITVYLCLERDYEEVDKLIGGSDSDTKATQTFRDHWRKGLKQKEKKIVQINVGLMTFKEEYLKPQPGRTFPLRTNSDITAPSLLNEAVKKMMDLIKVKDVEDKGPFLLLYPDGTEVINIPGTQRPFTLDAYKAKVGKAYQRITIYLCLERDYEEVEKLIGGSDSDTEATIKSSSEIHPADTLSTKKIAACLTAAETTKPCPTRTSRDHWRKSLKQIEKKIVQISIGLMAFQRLCLAPQRGKTFPLRTDCDITAPSLLNEAVKKMKDFIEVKDVEDKGPFLLLYPDGTEVINIPGTQKPFTLDAYKAKVGKAYQRITVYLCLKRDYKKVAKLLGRSDSDTEATIKSSSEIHPADTLPLEAHHESSLLQKVAETENDTGNLVPFNQVQQEVDLDKNRNNGGTSKCVIMTSPCDRDTNVQGGKMMAHLAMDGAVQRFQCSTYSDSNKQLLLQLIPFLVVK